MDNGRCVSVVIIGGEALERECTTGCRLIIEKLYRRGGGGRVCFCGGGADATGGGCG